MISAQLLHRARGDGDHTHKSKNVWAPQYWRGKHYWFCKNKAQNRPQTHTLHDPISTKDAASGAQN